MRAGVWHRWHIALAHAFAVDPGPAPLAAQDEAMLDRLAAAIVRRGLSAPALLFLDAFAPLNFLGSQALYAIAPLLDLAGGAADAERLAAVLERRDAVEVLRARIETAAEISPASGSASPVGPGGS